ncbi:hypothetical protein K7432_000698 [Basidiobolus ranarum]|uniref:Uncharacterized protein n=1 Tax=Basidiobolus ranarum TaxID=34480 RepID=A0ABR2X474_9FUNG
MDSLRKIRGLFSGNPRDRRRNDTPYTRPEAQPTSRTTSLLSFLVPRIFLYDEPTTSREETVPQHIRKERERVYKNSEEEQKSRRSRRQRERSTRIIVEQDKDNEENVEFLEQVAAVAPAPVLNSNIFTQTSSWVTTGDDEETFAEPMKVESLTKSTYETFQTPRALDMKSPNFRHSNFNGAMSPSETVSKFLHAKGSAQMEAEELEGCVALLKNEIQEEEESFDNFKSIDEGKPTLKRPFVPSTQVTKITSTVPRTALFSNRKKKAPLYFGPGFGRHCTPYRKIIKPPVYSSPPSTKRARVESYTSQKGSSGLQSTTRENTTQSLRTSTLTRSAVQAQTPRKDLGSEDNKAQKSSATARRIMDIIGEMDPHPAVPAAQDILNPYELASPISRRRTEPKAKPEIVAKTITTSAKMANKKLTPMELLEKSMPKELREEAPPVASISSTIVVPSTKTASTIAGEISSSQSVKTIQPVETKTTAKKLESAFRSVEASIDNSKSNTEQTSATKTQTVQLESHNADVSAHSVEPTFNFSLSPSFDLSDVIMQEISKIPQSELPVFKFGNEAKPSTKFDASAATSLLNSGISSVKAPNLKLGKSSAERVNIPTPTKETLPAISTPLVQESSDVQFNFTFEAAYNQQDPILKEVADCLIAKLPKYEFQIIPETN